MKNSKPALIIGSILVITIIALSLVGKDFIKNQFGVQDQAAQDKNADPYANKQDIEKQIAASKNNSFSTGTLSDKKQGIENDDMDAMLKRGKTYLLTQVDNRIRQLTPFKGRIEKADVLSESDRNSVVAELAEEIATLEALKPEISRSVTKEEIRTVADKVKAEWLKSRVSVARGEGIVFVAKENQLVAEADSAASGIKKRIAALKAEGKDTKTHEQLLSAFSGKLASAKQDIESAKENLGLAADASTVDEKEKIYNGNNKLLSSAQGSIREAYRLVHEAAKQDFNNRMNKQP
jgi:hypothetical protein